MSAGKSNYTSGMEKAMYQSHGISYSVYNSNVKNLLKVEAKRDSDYKEGNKFASVSSHN